MPIPLLQIIVALVVVGLILWVVQQIPMDPTIARIIKVVVIVVVCLWLLSLISGWGILGTGWYLAPRR